MINPIITAAQHVFLQAPSTAIHSSEQTAVSANKSQAQSGANTAQDIATLSAGARAAVQEATETSVQTAHEAQNGDHVAQSVLAREEAAKTVKPQRPL